MGILSDKYWDEYLEEKERREMEAMPPFVQLIMEGAREQEFALSMRLLDEEKAERLPRRSSEAGKEVGDG